MDGKKMNSHRRIYPSATWYKGDPVQLGQLTSTVTNSAIPK